MIPEIGHFALITALALALVQSTVPLLGAWRGEQGWMALAVPAARAQFLFVLSAFVCLAWSFVVKDFSVAYVANNANNELPLVYRIAAVWGAHEGSLLLWSLILGVWTVAVSYASRSLPAPVRARVIGVMGIISVGFLLFMLTTSDPFTRLLPPPANGSDLNPLLQDPGLVMHPPMLYMGYVGLSVPFAFAIAALLGGRLDAAWTRWTRPWTTAAWTFLSVGIAAGSAWSYYVLGWGGWWFWDPVENASFMPWLVATALIHSQAVTEKRGAFRAWTVLLSIFGFTLSLVGTFLVRSGVLVSVHAFATDPARGVFILAFIGVIVGAALLLFAWRGASVSAGGNFELVSRETLLLVNNVLLVVGSASVLLGTLYPLIVDALHLGKISVGPPWFDAVFVPLMLPLLAILGLGPLTRWKRDKGRRLGAMLARAATIAVTAGIALALMLTATRSAAAMLALALAAWIAITTWKTLADRLANKRDRLAALRRLPRAFVGMLLAHLGVAIFVVGVTVASGSTVQRNLALKPGASAVVDGYTVRFDGIKEVPGPNYNAQQGTLKISRGGRQVAVMHPQKRRYVSQDRPITEAAIDGGVLRDLYVALGERLANGAWAMRFYVKPMVRWIWFGPLLMALGGVLCVTDRRYRVRIAATDTQAADDMGGAVPATARG